MSKTKRNVLALMIIVGAFSLLLLKPASAQSVYGSIFGTVTDRSGAVIPNAAITVTDETKGTVFSVVFKSSPTPRRASTPHWKWVQTAAQLSK